MTHAVTHIGLIVIFGIVFVPVYVMFAGWLVGKPREYRPVGIAFGYLIGFILLTLIGIAVLGTVIGAIIAI